jgi:hypothetical protein
MPVYECDLCEACPPEHAEEWAVGDDSLNYFELFRIVLLLTESRTLRQFLQALRELRAAVSASISHDEEPDDPEDAEASVPYTAIEDVEEPQAPDEGAGDEERAGKQSAEIDSTIEQPLRT